MPLARIARLVPAIIVASMVTLGGCATMDLSPHPPAKRVATMPSALAISIVQYVAPERQINVDERVWSKSFATVQGRGEEEFSANLRQALRKGLENRGFAVRETGIRLPEVFSRPEPYIAGSAFVLTGQAHDEYAKRYRADFERAAMAVGTQMRAEGLAALAVVAWKRSTVQLRHTNAPTDTFFLAVRIFLADGSLVFHDQSSFRAWGTGKELGPSPSGTEYELVFLGPGVVAEGLAKESLRAFPKPDRMVR